MVNGASALGISSVSIALLCYAMLCYANSCCAVLWYASLVSSLCQRALRIVGKWLVLWIQACALSGVVMMVMTERCKYYDMMKLKQRALSKRRLLTFASSASVLDAG